MKQTRVAIYARVSGNGQNPEMQIKELQAYCRSRGWEIAGEYVDRTPGASDSRPELNRLMADERVRAGLRNAKSNGVKLGRPPLRVLSIAEVQQRRRGRKKTGESFKGLAQRYGISVWTAFQVCKSKA